MLSRITQLINTVLKDVTDAGQLTEQQVVDLIGELQQQQEPAAVPTQQQQQRPCYLLAVNEQWQQRQMMM